MLAARRADGLPSHFVLLKASPGEPYAGVEITLGEDVLATFDTGDLEADLAAAFALRADLVDAEMRW